MKHLFLVPSPAVFMIFMPYPLSYTICLSSFEWNMVKPVKKFVGLANYAAIFRDPDSWKIAGNAAVYVLVLLALNFMLPYILSFILPAVVKRGQGFYKAMFFLLSVIFLVAGSIPHIWILNPISGPVTLVLEYLGLALPFWSKAEGRATAVLSTITFWKVFGHSFIIILVSVSRVSQEVVEAARLDSIPLWKVSRDTAVPMSSATGIYAFTTTIAQGLRYVFTPIKMVIQGGLDYASSNLIHMSCYEAFTLYHTDTSSATSVIIMVLFIVPPLLELRLVEKGVYYEN